MANPRAAERIDLIHSAATLNGTSFMENVTPTVLELPHEISRALIERYYAAEGKVPVVDDVANLIRAGIAAEEPAS